MKKISSFPSHPKFLIDENVRIELSSFLKKEGYDVKIAPKGSSDTQVASLSKSDKRILVTNDMDFTDPGLYSSKDLYALIWLRIPQAEKEALISSFHRLVSEYQENYGGKFIILQSDFWNVYDFEERETLLESN